MPQFDILVVGAGLVGMSCALALSRQGMKVGLVEAKPESASPPSVSARDWDSRIYAISPTNAGWLADMGAWPRLAESRVCPIAQMQIFGDAAASRLQFDADEACVD